jgi:hypothetical protein
MMMQEIPGGTREQYDEVCARLTGGRSLSSLSDWPVEGILSHAAGPTDDGWCVVDVWESEEAFRRFGEVIVPILQELGVPGEPRVLPVHNVVR